MIFFPLIPTPAHKRVYLAHLGLLLTIIDCPLLTLFFNIFYNCHYVVKYEQMQENYTNNKHNKWLR